MYLRSAFVKCNSSGAILQIKFHNIEPATLSKQIPENHTGSWLVVSKAVFLKNASKDCVDFLHESSLL